MAKLVRIPLALLWLLFIPAPARAVYLGDVPAQLAVTSSLTKLADNEFRFDYSAHFVDYFLPPPYIDPTGLLTEYYLPGFGFATFPDVPDWAGLHNLFSDSIQIAAPPSTINLHGWREIWTIATSESGHDVHGQAGALVGNVTLYGDVPTEIGQTVSWNVVPELPAWLLGTLMLLGFCIVKGKALILRRFEPVRAANLVESVQ